MKALAFGLRFVDLQGIRPWALAPPLPRAPLRDGVLHLYINEAGDTGRRTKFVNLTKAYGLSLGGLLRDP